MRPVHFATLLGPIAIAVITLGYSTATAQPALSRSQSQTKPISGLPVESVTVVAIKPSGEIIKSFVETRAAPTAILGKIARWQSKICPQTLGLRDVFTKYVTQRIRDIATAVGAPVNADPACKPNIEVVFTTAPQRLLDNIRTSHPVVLGFYYNSRGAEELAKITHPIQAWYTTETVDFDGTAQIDDKTCGVAGTTTMNYTDPSGATAGVSTLVLPCAITARSSGSRANDGLNSGYFNVLIVAEPAKLYDYEVGSLADYITLLALSQPASLDSCQKLLSISNLLAPNCASVSNRITDGDLAYLRALYKMGGGEFLAVQQDYIREEMYKTLVTDKGG